MTQRQTLTSPAIYRWYADEGMHVEIEWVEPPQGFYSAYEVFLNGQSIGFVASYGYAGFEHEAWTYATERGALFCDVDHPHRFRLTAVAALVEPLRPKSKDS